MLGFHFSDSGEKVKAEVLRRQEFVLGRAKMQTMTRGIVELSDGTVRTFSVRHAHSPNSHGHFKTVGDPRNQTFEDAVEDLRDFEKEWITEELPEYRRDLKVNPLMDDTK